LKPALISVVFLNFMFSLYFSVRQAFSAPEPVSLERTMRANPIDGKRPLGRLRWRVLLVLFLLSASSGVSAQAPAWQWATSPGVGTGVATAVDAAGNVYVIGHFMGMATFGTTTLTSAGDTDVFVAKLASSGAYQWAVRAGGANDDAGFNIAVDGSGNVLITGYFGSPTIAFGTTTLSSVSNISDVFVAKLTSTGAWQWATSTGGRGVASGFGLAIDGDDGVLITGHFYSPTITFGTTTLTNAHSGFDDIFIAKLTPIGTWQWAISAGGNGRDSGEGIAIDDSGNVVVFGSFRSTAITFGTTTLTNTGIFVAKLTPAGTWQWATSVEGEDAGFGIAIDSIGNVVVTGNFRLTISFGTTTLTNTGSADLFVAKLTSAGDWQWATNARGSSSGYGVAMDDNGDVFVTGSFRGPSVTFGTTTLINTGFGSDIFVSKLNSAGAWQWAIGAGTSGDDAGLGLAADGNGNVVATGNFQSQTIAFGATTLSNSGFYASFIARLSGTTGLPESPADQPPLAFSPNPASTTVHLTGAAGATATLLNGLGRVVGNAPISPAGTTTLNVSALPAGLYLLRAGGATRRLMVE
jgi:hypothetical protein